MNKAHFVFLMLAFVVVASSASAANYRCFAKGLKADQPDLEKRTVVVRNPQGKSTLVRLRPKGRNLVGSTPKYKVPVTCTQG